MDERPRARDCVSSMIPVFCIAEIPVTTINKFFTEANEATNRNDYGQPQCFLMTTDDVSRLNLSRATEPRIDVKALRFNPFLGTSASQVAVWARTHLDRSDLSPVNIVIIDERSPRDDTCLLVSLRDVPDESTGEDKIYLRADFESSILPLKTIEIGVGGEEHLDVGYKGSDGVLRISVKDGRTR